MKKDYDVAPVSPVNFNLSLIGGGGAIGATAGGAVVSGPVHFGGASPGSSYRMMTLPFPSALTSKEGVL